MKSWKSAIRSLWRSIQKWAIENRDKYPRQESNLVFDLRRVACDPQHSEDMLSIKCPAEELNLVRQFRGLPCLSDTPAGQLSRPGIGPGHHAQQWSWTFGGSRAIHYTIETQGWELGAGSLTVLFPAPSSVLPASRADDWIRTSIEQFTKLLPRHSATSAFLCRCRVGLKLRPIWPPDATTTIQSQKAGVQGFEPCRAALEAASSPMRTLLWLGAWSLELGAGNRVHDRDRCS
jgi:hypothetical protein